MEFSRAAIFVSEYGYLLIFIATALENSIFVGLFVPGVVVLLLAGFLASQGQLNLPIVMLIAFTGGLIGDNLGYWIGRKGGRPFLEKYRKFLRMTPARLKEVEDYYDNHGGKTVFTARFTAVLHTLAPLLAGISRMRYAKFVFFNVLAGLTWSVSVPLLGYFFGESLGRVKNVIGKINLVILVIVIAGIALYIWRKRASKPFSSKD